MILRGLLRKASLAVTVRRADRARLPTLGAAAFVVLVGTITAFAADARIDPRFGSQASASPGLNRLARFAQSDEAPARKTSSNSTPTIAKGKETTEYRLSPERYAKAVAYSRAGYRLYFIRFAYGLGILWMLLRWGVAKKFRDWAEEPSGNRFVQVAIFVGMLALTMDVLELPARVYGHLLALRYNQSVQGWGSWLWDWTKEQAIGLIFGILLTWILFRIIRRSPRRWWLYFWMAAIPIGLLLVFSGPLIIDPLFNKFEPLKKSYPELVTAMESVVRRAGMEIPEERMFLMRASEKSNQINAYVTGIGASKRVVVWDNTIRNTSIQETLFVFGHEMGHYVLHHIRKGFLFFAAFLLVLFFGGFYVLHWVLNRRGASWGIYGAEDLATLPVMLLLLSITLFLCSPIINGYSRHVEHEADIYGLEVIHGIVPNSSEVAAHAFQVLGEIDLDDPDPPGFIAFWLYSHPPLGDRLVFAHTYDPWSKGESPKFVK